MQKRWWCEKRRPTKRKRHRAWTVSYGLPPAAKMRGVLTLTDKGYKAKPLRRVFIDTSFQVLSNIELLKKQFI